MRNYSNFEYLLHKAEYELMNFGIIVVTEFTGVIQSNLFKGKYTNGTDKGDFTSQIYDLRRSEADIC